MALHMGPPVTPVVAICGPRGSDTSKITDWMREAFECRNPVIRADDFFKVHRCHTKLKIAAHNSVIKFVDATIC